MKRLFCVLIAITFLFACAPSYDILSYQQGNISAVCVINGKYTVNIIKKEDIRALEIIEPSELSNIAFKREGNEWVASCDEVSIPIESEYLSGISTLCSIFDLDEGAITTARDENGLGIVSFSMSDVAYQVTYDSQALPEKIKITGNDLDFDIEIISISKN